jgi:single-stranded-DNA-specific exonuclease
MEVQLLTLSSLYGKETVIPRQSSELVEAYLTQEKRYLIDENALKNLTSPFLLKDIEQASQRVLKAIENKEYIVLLTDHDCDGQSSCAVLSWSFKYIFSYHNFKAFISHRTKEGYGVSEGVVNRILQDKKPSLIITADCGITCDAQIERLAHEGVDVIVTDHHTLSEAGPPKKAHSVINPQQKDCLYPDKNISGCFVAWLFMAAVRQALMKALKIKLPSMAQCLDFVSIGTIADCMSLKKSLNNRIAVKYGLKLIRQKVKPAWRALLEKYSSYVTSEFLSFKLIPLLNADGRIFDALTSVNFLISRDLLEAQRSLASLVDTNAERKILTQKQKELIEEYSFNQNDGAVIVNLGEKGHAGIHGIAANKICQETNLPVIIFSQSMDEEKITASARSPKDFSLKKLFDTVYAQCPEIIVKYGGHHQAAGITIEEKNFSKFRQICLELIKKEKLMTKTFTIDYFCQLSGEFIFSPAFWLEFENTLEPFGQDFLKPSFAIQCCLENYQLVGENKNHIHFTFNHHGSQFKAMIFFQNKPDILIDALLEEPLLVIGKFHYDLFYKKQTLTFYIEAVVIENKGLVYYQQDFLPYHLKAFEEQIA